MSSAAKLQSQPVPRLSPIPLHRPHRDSQRLRGLYLRQPAEVAALHYLAQPLIYHREALQRFIKSDQPIALLGDCDLVLQREWGYSATTAQGPMTASVVYQNPTHCPGSDPKEVRPVPPMNPRLIHHLEVGFVHQGTSVERMIRSLLLQLPVSEPAEFPVNQRKEVAHCLRVAPTNLEEEFSDR